MLTLVQTGLMYVLALLLAIGALNRLTRDPHEHPPPVATPGGAKFCRDLGGAAPGLYNASIVVVAGLSNRAVEITPNLNQAGGVVVAVLRDRAGVVASELANSRSVALAVLGNRRAVVGAFLLDVGAVFTRAHYRRVDYGWDVAAFLGVGLEAAATTVRTERFIVSL